MTPRQRDCLQAIQELTIDGVAPTYAQLCVRLGLAPTSKSIVHRLIPQLERQGFLRRAPHCQQSIEIIRRSGAALTDARIALMTDEALESALTRISAALSRRRTAASERLVA